MEPGREIVAHAAGVRNIAAVPGEQGAGAEMEVPVGVLGVRDCEQKYKAN